MTELSPGTKILYLDGRPGLVRFAGTTHFAPGEWIGIELDDGGGKNDGSVQGQRYFDCDPGHGMFVRPDAVTIDSSTPMTNGHGQGKSVNGIEARSRQSIMSAETARKRQSLMGSRATPGSRPSMRSPTKSPSKASSPQENGSGHSSPRTSTPGTTARTSKSSVKSRPSVSGRPSMAPPPPMTPKTQTRSSLSGTPLKTSYPDIHSRPTTSIRNSVSKPEGHRLSLSRERSPTKIFPTEETLVSPPIAEEEDEYDPNIDHGLESNSVPRREVPPTESIISPILSPIETKETPIPYTIPNGLDPTRTRRDNLPTLSKELEQMKAKYKIMERKRMEDRDRIKGIESLKLERDRFENTMQKLQRKCQTQAQDIAECRRQVQESESRADTIERADAERGTEIELANLDKEMAEERLEAAAAELEALKERCEELELETEIVRDENKELSSGMTSEERSNAGWLQIEKENNRLRDALVALRDMTQETESGLKGHVRELENDLGDFESLKGEHEKALTDLKSCHAAIKTLKDNIEATDSQEVLVSDLTDAKDALAERLDSLSAHAKVLEKEIEDYQQIQETQDAMEKCLQDDLDDVQEVIREQSQQLRSKSKVIDDLEGTLIKFKEVTMGLQKDLEELRASKEVSQTETTELTARSREMMDLNLRLQNSAAKTQARKVESELVRIRGEDSALHASILQKFLPDSFKTEKDPISTLLRFKRLTAKASLLRSTTEDSLGENQNKNPTNSFATLELREKLQWVSLTCSRCYEYMSNSSPEAFARVETALHELDPVERSLDLMIDGSKRMEIDGPRWIVYLQRMTALLADLVEKTVPTALETFAESASARAEMIQLYSETTVDQLALIKQIWQGRTPENDEDDSHQFGQELQRIIDRGRTCRVVAGKVLRSVDENKNRLMTLGETSLSTFETAEAVGQDLSSFTRLVGQTLLDRFDAEVGSEESSSLDDVQRVVQDLTNDWIKDHPNEVASGTDLVASVGQVLSAYKAKLDLLVSLSSDLSNFSEYERPTHPWILRAKAIQQRRIVDPEMEAQLRKYQTESHEKTVAINAQNKVVDEQNLKIEVLDARGKDHKDQSAALQRLETRLAEASSERDKALTMLKALLEDKVKFQERLAEANESRGRAGQAQDSTAASNGTLHIDANRITQTTATIKSLQEEVTALQSAVRFLKLENHRLLHPISATTLATTNHAWLESNPLPIPNKPTSTATDTPTGAVPATEARQVFKSLLEVTTFLKPLQLQPQKEPPMEPPPTEGISTISSWRPRNTTPRYLAALQREQLEHWLALKNDSVQRARGHGVARKKATPVVLETTSRWKGKGKMNVDTKGDLGQVQIVGGSPPR